jgi:mRNA-degrading endonuclease RelE of RelBE toxin-antitoxin system
MPKIQLTERFQKSYSELPFTIQKKAKKALRLLAVDPRYPSLQTKPIEGAPGIYEARVDRKYRLTFERLPGDILLLRVIGAHDETLRNP